MLKALYRIGWREGERKGGSHVKLSREGSADYTWAFHAGDTIGPAMLSRIAKHTGLTPDDL